MKGVFLWLLRISVNNWLLGFGICGTLFLCNKYGGVDGHLDEKFCDGKRRAILPAG